MDTELLVEIATFVGVGVTGWLVTTSKDVMKTAAEEGAKTAIKNFNWREELAQELEKARGTERQEVRFKSYGKLWAKLRALAIYESKDLGQKDVAVLTASLSDWYFSEDGGLMLTAHLRGVYFALQDLLRAVSQQAEWTATRPADGPDEMRATFKGILKERGHKAALEMLEHLETLDKDELRNWPDGMKDRAKGWQKDVRALGGEWMSFSSTQQFVILQQVASVLRTCLTMDTESRLR